MILLLITIIPQITHEDNRMTLLFITIMSQIIYKEFIFFYFLTFFYVNASQESCMWTEENMSMLVIILGCDEEYIVETSRTFGERYKEHLKAPSAIHHHSSQTGHPTSHNNFQIIGRQGHNLAGNIKESIYIRVINPTLNNNIGKSTYPTFGIGSYLILKVLL